MALNCRTFFSRHHRVFLSGDRLPMNRRRGPLLSRTVPLNLPPAETSSGICTRGCRPSGQAMYGAGGGGCAAADAACIIPATATAENDQRANRLDGSPRDQHAPRFLRFTPRTAVAFSSTVSFDDPRCCSAGGIGRTSRARSDATACADPGQFVVVIVPISVATPCLPCSRQ